jgi:hypothetical protein
MAAYSFVFRRLLPPSRVQRGKENDLAYEAAALRARGDHFEALAQRLKSENELLGRKARELRGRVDDLTRHDERDRLREQVQPSAANGGVSARKRELALPEARLTRRDTIGAFYLVPKAWLVYL